MTVRAPEGAIKGRRSVCNALRKSIVFTGWWRDTLKVREDGDEGCDRDKHPYRSFCPFYFPFAGYFLFCLVFHSHISINNRFQFSNPDYYEFSTWYNKLNNFLMNQ